MRAASLLLFALLLEAQPAGVTFRIATAGGKTRFRIGEPVVLELSFASTPAVKYSIFISNPDRSGPENMSETYHVSPRTGWSDPLADYLGLGSGGSGPGSMKTLEPKPFVIRKELNQWVRFEKPGVYRVRATTNRIPVQPKPVPVDSNEIEIEILPADRAWAAAQLREAAGILRTVPPGPDSRVFLQRMDAARRIWYLGTPESVVECARLLGGSDPQVGYTLQFALLGTRHRDLAIKTMREVLADPAYAVSQGFVETLARVESWRQMPLGPYPADVAVQAAWREASQRRYQLQMDATKQLLRQLADAIGRKQGAAKGVSLQTLAQTSGPGGVPASLRAELAATFAELPPQRQAELLGWQWGNIAGPAMVPVLRRIVDATPDTIYQAPPLHTEALRRLHELDPPQGRKLILDEMRRPFPRYPYAVLAMLPDQTLPSMDGVLIDDLERSPEKAAQRDIEELIARYGTGRIAGRVKAFYARVDAAMRARPTDAWNMTSPPVKSLAAPACEPPLIAYFLRVEPATGKKLLRQALAERWAETGRCWIWVLGQTARYHVSPEWEAVAVSALEDPAVQVKTDAVKALEEHGSPKVEAPLWKSFEYWHAWWKDRAAEMNDENRQLEWAYMRALPSAKNWVTTGEGFARMRDLCISPGCRTQAGQLARMWAGPLTVSVNQTATGEFVGMVAQYHMQSLGEVRRRLLQMPRGTVLSWRQNTWENKPFPALDAWFARTAAELRARGITLIR